jgi:hypothetical protein
MASDSPKPSQKDEAHPAIPYWSEGRARPFVSGLVVAGVGYGRVAFDAGYGKPHWIWAGVEGTGLITPDYTSMQVYDSTYDTIVAVYRFATHDSQSHSR